MKILIVTPTIAAGRSGNQVTAARWAGFLRQLSCRTTIRPEHQAGRFDAVFALHARKSSDAVLQSYRADPRRPVVVAITGTDIDDLATNSRARRSLELARFLVTLNPAAKLAVPQPDRARTRVILQSAERLGPLAPLRSRFEVCVVGHLRPVKDPFRTAYAARRLPASSRICITHLGAALTPAMRERAEAEMARNPRYRWLGNRPRGQTRRILARSRLMVLTSKSEGGPSVLSEAIQSSVPVLSARISAVTSLLGDDYPGYFAVGDTAELARLLRRCEQDQEFYEQLREAGAKHRELFSPQRELRAWRTLLADLRRVL